jgi:hypothetical protein
MLIRLGLDRAALFRAALTCTALFRSGLALRCASCVPFWSGLFQLRAALAPNHAVPFALPLPISSWSVLGPS